MASRINARIDDELAQKLEELARATGKSSSAIIKAALEAYIASAQESGAAHPRLALERAGFLACASGEPDLSSSYKKSLAESLGRKA